MTGLRNLPQMRSMYWLRSQSNSASCDNCTCQYSTQNCTELFTEYYYVPTNVTN